MTRFALALVFSAAAFAADTPAPTVARIYNQDFSTIERELVPLVEAMPADKFQFAPTNGEFAGVRTFAQQATHTGAVIYAVAAAVLVEKNPIDMGANENGPASLKSKEAIVKFLKEAFAYGHKAMNSLTRENVTELVPSAFGSGKAPRGRMASIATWHSFDHYGQMVVYARMNGVIPPASRR